ncbi:hypothetical protein MRB53_038959 [Persea americana]|nr:hypothetical protein MRB53_038959 [Persea americana]
MIPTKAAVPKADNMPINIPLPVLPSPCVYIRLSCVCAADDQLPLHTGGLLIVSSMDDCGESVVLRSNEQMRQADAVDREALNAAFVVDLVTCIHIITP